MNAHLQSSIALLRVAGTVLGEARAYEQQLEDERPLIKEMAIIRIMEKDKIAATRAEKIVESDLEYMKHRVAQRASIVARFRADAEYHAAIAEATQASLITPDLFALEADLAELAEANNSLLHARKEAEKIARDFENRLNDANATLDHLVNSVTE
jgi:hypothetical protein